ncbi:MAG: hypothetical protein ACETVR_03975, partial [Candidatus Bathyarchaeia archaeon]
IAEVLNASCFAHHYSTRSPKLSEVYGPTLCSQILRRAAEERWALQEMSFNGLEEWFRSFPEGEILSEVYHLYLEEWESAMGEMGRVVKTGWAGGTAIFFVMAQETPLMPLAASVKIHELKRSEGEEILLLVFRESSSGVNISARGTGQKIHCGFFLNALARRIVERFGFPGSVSGGGHVRAGECVLSTTKVRSEKIMEELTVLIQDITLIDHLYERGSLPKSGFERAEELGLRYITR